MSEHIIKVVEEIIGSKKYELFNDLLSLEERIEFFNFSDRYLYRQKFEDYNLILLNVFLKESDENKIRCIDIALDDDYKAVIIASLKSEEKKIEYLEKKLLDDSSKAYIIASLTNEEKKIEYLEKLLDDSSKTMVIESLTSDEVKIRCLDKISDDLSKVEIIESLTSDENKIRCLDKILDDTYTARVIASLISDEKKIEYLNDLSDDRSKWIIIASLTSDENKEKYLDKILDESYKEEIIASLISDENKIRCLDKISSDSSKARVIRNLTSDENKIRYLDKILDESYKVEIIASLTDKDKIRCLDKILDESSKVEIIASLTDEDKIRCLDKILDDSSKAKVIRNLTSNEIREKFLKNNISEDVLKSLQENFGISSKPEDVLRLLEITKTGNLWEIITNDEIYKRFINLFNKKNFIIDSEHRNNFIEIGLCKMFEIENTDICQIFSIILRLCNDNKKEDIKKLLEGIIKIGEITENINGKNLSDFIKAIRSDTISLDDFIDSLIAGNQETFNILHSITNDYKKIILEDYKKENRKQLEEQIVNHAKVNGLVKISQKNLMEYIFNEISYEVILSLIRELCQNDMELKILCSDNLDKLIKCKKEKGRVKELSKDERNKLKLILNYIYDNHYDSLIRYVNLNIIKIDGNIRIMNNRKMEVIFNAMKNGELYKLLCDLDKYKKIEILINKFHIIGCEGIFNTLFEDIGIADFYLDYFIENITKITNNLNVDDKGNIKLVDALKLMRNFDKNLVVLLGEENAKLINTNPGPNAASGNVRHQRNKLAIDYLKVMYNRNKVNVPPIAETITLENGKVINVNVGNFTNPINLTYGERTGACMRIKGSGEGLFDFCLRNDAGFHIRFSTSDERFVSRVSGFRVGNTVFLNELRNSVCNEISDNDVLLACKKVSQMLIDKSRKSDYPIENVVIHNAVVLAQTETDVNFTDTFEKGFDSPKYTSVRPDKCILLATTGKDGKVVPFDKKKPMESYPVLREKVRYIDNSLEIRTMIDKIKLLNKVLSAEDIDNFVYDTTSEYILAYIGDDFCIAINNKFEIETYTVNREFTDERTKSEINDTYEKMKEMLISYQKDKDNSIILNEGVSRSRGLVAFTMLLFISLVLSIITFIISLGLN